MRRVTLAWLLASSAAAADPPRHLVCHDDRPVPATASRPASPAADWLPLSKKRAPRFESAKLDVFDVPEVRPLPTRRASSRPPAVEPARVAVESRNTWRCIGVPRGTPGILRVISAPDGARFYGQPYLESWRQENLQAAGELALTSMVPAVRRELERPLPKGAEAWKLGELSRTKHAAARALADLGDGASAPAVLALIRGAERDGFHLWRESLDSLARLDAGLAQRYALELIARAVDDPRWLAKNPTLYTDLLPLVTARSDEARAVLRRGSGMLTKDDVNLPHGTGGCEFLAARVRLGDLELTQVLRAELGTDSLSTQRAVACYSTLMPSLYPGRDASELDVLMHRHRYHELLEWIGKRNSTDAEKKRARAWLEQRSKAPDVAGDRTRRDFIPDKRAMHLVAQSALGDAQAERALAKLAGDPDDDGTAPWVAVWYMLKLELPGASELAVQRLLRARSQHTRRFSSESWPRRGSVTITEHGRVVEDLARRGDARYSLGLLDSDPFTRRLTTTVLARKRTESACQIVAEAAQGATAEAVDEAFWALSLLGDRCRGAMQALVADSRQPKWVRGMANEHLAMLRDPGVPKTVAAQRAVDGLSASAWRARVIYESRE